MSSSSSSFQLPKDWPKDPRSIAYGKYLHAYFTGRLPGNLPPSFEPADGRGVGKDRCALPPPSKPLKKGEIAVGKIMQQQLVVNMIVQAMLKDGYPQRGLMLFHSVGTGKSCSAVGCMDAAWDLPERRILYVTSVDALSSNPPSTFHKCAGALFPRFQPGKTLDDVGKMFTQRKVEFLSFAQLANKLMIGQTVRKSLTPTETSKRRNYLQNALLIMDEVHGLFKPLPNQRQQHNAIVKLLTNATAPETKGLKMIVMTATPGDTPGDCVTLLNLLRDPRAPAIVVPDFKDATSADAFKRSILGLVSHIDLSADLSRYPKLVELAPYKLPMSMQQFVKYLDAFYDDTHSKRTQYDVLSKENRIDRYFQSSRKYSNMLYKFDDALPLEQFSAKIPKLLEVVQMHPREKHYVYSSFSDHRGSSHGILGIEHYLEKQLGYKPFTLDQAKAVAADGTDAAWAKLGQRKRYMLVLSSTLGGPEAAATRKGREALVTLLKVFNDARNRRGEYVHVLLTSQNFFQGVDLNAVRHIHIFEPFLSYTADIQAIGRGRRQCSHRFLPYGDEWTVTVHRYMSEMPTTLRLSDPEAARQRAHQLADAIAREETGASRLAKESSAHSRRVAKNAGNAGLRELMTDAELKVAARDSHQHLRAMKLELQDIMWQAQARQLKMIDDLMAEETIRRSFELLEMYRAIKEAAIDCPLYADMQGVNCFVA